MKNKFQMIFINMAVIFFVLFAFGTKISGQDQQKGIKAKSSGARSYRVIPASSKIKIDGVLNETAWQEAEIIKLPYEYTPGDNTPAPVETDCMVTFSRTHFYIAYRCYDPEPKKIRAHLMNRDTINTFIQDDHITFMIDAFNDERRAFQFRVNPLGVQADANFSELEGYEDFSWDAIWESAGKITDFGYIVEVAVPFNQLRFAVTDEEQTWGFSATRSYPRSVRSRMASHMQARDSSCLMCQFNKLTGFKGMSPGNNLEFDPTLTVNRTDKRSDYPDGDIENGDIKFEPGISAKWGITPNVILNATVNPDFSQVEADVAQLEVNNRFALRYPEKRPFFLEGADFFLTPIEAVFSRTFYNPLWGAKLTSKFGKNALGFFAVQDTSNNLIIPSNQGSDSVSIEENVYGGILRYRRDIGSGSNLGILYTGKVGDDYHNHVVGIDGFFRLSRSKTISFQYLYSNTSYPENVAQDYDQESGSFTGSGIKAQFNHLGRNLFYSLTYDDLSPQFRADSGFVPRVDYRMASLFVMPRIYGKSNSWFTQIYFLGQARMVVDYEGSLTDQQILVASGYNGPLQSNLELGANLNREKYLDITYNVNNLYAFLQLKPADGVNLNLFSQYGDSIDYSNSRLATSFLINPSIELGIGKHLNINLNHIYENLSAEGNKIYNVNLSQARIVYNINIRTFVRAIVQYTDLNRNLDMYNFDTDPVYKGLFTQLLFSYKINPQTVLFLGYSDNSMGLKGIDIKQTDRTFFLKIGYALIY